jgi:CRISPR system Cascade subunit CasB
MMPLDVSIERLSRGLLGLDPGPLAELRRMAPGGPGVPAYWRLANDCGFREDDADVWMQVVKIMAILSPKGQRSDKDRLHDASHRLGAALCDGGDPRWRPRNPTEPQGEFSEKRLARFLALSPAGRGEALERIARMLARSRDPARGIDCITLARLLLVPDDKRPLQHLARDYHRRLDDAARPAKQKETPE